MNSVNLVGRITKDPELRTSPSGVQFTSFSLAVRRVGTNQQGERSADFINCVAFNKQAETLVRYVRKGGMISVEGRLQVNNYQAQDGSNRSSMDVVCERITFLSSNNNTNQRSNAYDDMNYVDDYNQDYNQPQNNQYNQNRNYQPNQQGGYNNNANNSNYNNYNNMNNNAGSYNYNNQNYNQNNSNNYNNPSYNQNPAPTYNPEERSFEKDNSTPDFNKKEGQKEFNDLESQYQIDDDDVPF